MKQLVKLDIFIARMQKLGIDIKLIGNYPWIYIDTINGKRIKERYYAEHGWTIGFLPLRDKEFNFLDITELFKLIRKYK
jgi:hypothetical protein